MPKWLEKILEKQADKKRLKGKKRNAYIFSTLRKTGWKPKQEKEKHKKS